MQNRTSTAMMRAIMLLMPKLQQKSRRQPQQELSALPQGLSGGLGLPEFALFSQLQELAAFSNPQQSTFSQR